MFKYTRNKFVEYFSVFTVIAAPYTFLRPTNANLSLFDILLIFTGLIIIIKAKSIILFKNSCILYTMGLFFMMVLLLPVFKQSIDTLNFQAILQYFFIFFYMTPIVLSIFNKSEFSTYLDPLAITWSIFLLYNLFLLSDKNMYFANRFGSYYYSSGTFGLFISTYFPIVFSRFVKESSYIKRIIYLGGMVGSIICLVATGSRANTVSFVMGIIIFITLYYKISFKNFTKILTGITFLYIVIINTISNFERNPIARFFSGENTQGRFDDYYTSIQIFQNNFWVGTGIQGNLDLIQSYGSQLSHRPHNFFVAYLTEAGIIGLVIIVSIVFLLIGYSFKSIFLATRYRRKINNDYAAVFASSIALLIALQFSAPSVHRGVWFIWILCFAATINIRQLFHYKSIQNGTKLNSSNS